MYKISEFSKLSSLSIKTLRYYDQIELLKPVKIDEQTGYRYYDAKQLLTAKRIIMLKKEGFTLKQINELLNEPIADSKIKRILTQKREQLQNEISIMKDQLNQMEERIEQYELLDSINTLPPINIKHFQSQMSISIRDTIPPAQICILMDELNQHILSNGMREDDVTVIWHQTNHSHSRVDVELYIPASMQVIETERIKMREIPELKQAASYIHYCDPYQYKCTAEEELLAWMGENGYEVDINNPMRETYITKDKDLYGNRRVAELIIPIK